MRKIVTVVAKSLGLISALLVGVAAKILASVGPPIKRVPKHSKSRDTAFPPLRRKFAKVVEGI